jgi:hypothetical protein
MMLISKVIIVATLAVACNALAIELNDYAITMANDAIKSNDWGKAEVIVDDGLKQDPDDSQLKALRQQIESHKKADAHAKSQQVAAAKKAAQVDPVKKLSQIYCDCTALRHNNEATIKRENDAAVHSGMVNKNVLYKAGQMITFTEHIQNHIKADAKFSGPGICPLDSPYSGTQCLSYAADTGIQ